MVVVIIIYVGWGGSSNIRGSRLGRGQRRKKYSPVDSDTHADVGIDSDESMGSYTDDDDDDDEAWNT